jgi:predicted amidohydrolase YtcJ
MRHLACGITCVGDALVTPEVTELYRRAEQSKKLPFVLHQMFGGPHFFASPEPVAMGDIPTDDVSDRLRGGTMKIFMDPVYPRYALLRHQGCDQVEHLGERYYTQEEVDHLVRHAHQRGLQVAIHCLGNWSVEQALHAFERAQREHPHPDPRFRIEHFTVTSPDQMRRAQSLGVIASMQPPFVFQNGDRMTRTAREMGGETRALAFNSMQSAGVLVAASSDSPCAPLEPLLGLYAMVTRRTRRDGTPVSPEEAVTPLEGLRMYTANAAYAMRREHEVGSLERGKRADMVVLSHDPTVVDPTFIRDIAVEQSYVDGRLLYQR